VQAESRRHLENLTALQIRRTLIDLSRKYQRTVDQCASRWTPNSSDASHCRLQIEFTDSGSPENLEQWTRLHIQVDEMSESDREVFQLRVYRSMQRQEIADLLNVDITTVQRRWRSAREFLNARFPGDS
ncbi:MAG: hypothetical protein KDA89_13285, partial [Planctomycetaceae bacterium]|nr:hypothetical protein [Planctomycetaceae bacterium]